MKTIKFYISNFLTKGIPAQFTDQEKSAMNFFSILFAILGVSAIIDLAPVNGAYAFIYGVGLFIFTLGLRPIFEITGYSMRGRKFNPLTKSLYIIGMITFLFLLMPIIGIIRTIAYFDPTRAWN